MKNIVKMANMMELLPSKIRDAAHKAAKEAGQKIDELELHRHQHCEKAQVKDIDIKKRKALKYVSARTQDRDDEIVVPGGIDLKEFKKYGHVLVNHDYHELPIGSDEWIEADEFGIKAMTVYADTGPGTTADIVWKLVSQGHMKASSIGFVPIQTTKPGKRDWDTVANKLQREWKEFDKARAEKCVSRIVTHGILLEHSDVTVPCNTDAEMIQVFKGMGLKDGRVLKKLGLGAELQDGIYVPKCSVIVLKSAGVVPVKKDLPPVVVLKGGEGSGNFGHEGRPGEVGGSAPGGGSSGSGGSGGILTGKRKPHNFMINEGGSGHNPEREGDPSYDYKKGDVTADIASRPEKKEIFNSIDELKTYFSGKDGKHAISTRKDGSVRISTPEGRNEYKLENGKLIRTGETEGKGDWSEWKEIPKKKKKGLSMKMFGQAVSQKSLGGRSFDEFRMALQKLITPAPSTDGKCVSSPWIMDVYEDYFVYSKYENGKENCYAQAYTVDEDGKITLVGSPEVVERRIQYKPSTKASKKCEECGKTPCVCEDEEDEECEECGESPCVCEDEEEDEDEDNKPSKKGMKETCQRKLNSLKRRATPDMKASLSQMEEELSDCEDEDKLKEMNGKMNSMLAKLHVAKGSQGVRVLKGGEGSGNFGHAGRPGEVGGSAEGGGDGSSGGKESGKSDPNENEMQRRVESKAEEIGYRLDFIAARAKQNARRLSPLDEINARQLSGTFLHLADKCSAIMDEMKDLIKHNKNEHRKEEFQKLHDKAETMANTYEDKAIDLAEEFNLDEVKRNPSGKGMKSGVKVLRTPDEPAIKVLKRPLTQEELNSKAAEAVTKALDRRFGRLG